MDLDAAVEAAAAGGSALSETNVEAAGTRRRPSRCLLLLLPAELCATGGD